MMEVLTLGTLQDFMDFDLGGFSWKDDTNSSKNNC
jgi:hypothetical protein